jgi:hypothetical protein
MKRTKKSNPFPKKKRCLTGSLGRSLNSLPNDVLIDIFLFLSYPTGFLIQVLPLVCKDFRDLTFEVFSYITKFSISVRYLQDEIGNNTFPKNGYRTIPDSYFNILLKNENLEFLDLLALRYTISYPCTLKINELYLDGSLSVLNYVLEVDTLFIRNCDCREISKFPRIHNLTYDRCTNLVIPENVNILNIYEYKTDNVLDLSRCSQLEELDLMEVEAMAFYIPQHIKTLRIENVKPVIDIDNILSNFPYLEILEYDGHIEVMS